MNLPYRRNFRVILLALALCWTGACSSSSQDATESTNDTFKIDESHGDVGLDSDASDEESVITYHQDIAPIIDKRCNSCHVEDGSGPLTFDTYETLSVVAPVVLASVESGAMPPWPPDPECREYVGSRSMPAFERELLRQWVDQGKREGQLLEGADEEPKKEAVEPREPDIIAKIRGPYTPNDKFSDDYRCFLTDSTFEKDTYVIGSDVIPGHDGLVHHANIFIVNRHDEQKVEELESASDEAGYPCFGDPGFSSINVLGAWVPGAQPVFMPENSAAILPAGSRIVMQVHFNTQYAATEPVQPEFHIYTMDEVPAQRVRAMPFADLNFVVPAGDAESEHTQEYRNRSNRPWRAIGIFPHMHLFGKSATAEVVRKDDDNLCLIDIPKWDMNWQQEYRFLDHEWVDIEPGDSIRLSCVFDNSPENQPVIDGEKMTPKPVRWGARSLDEMCLFFLVVIEDYEPVDDDTAMLCENFETCRTDCDDPFGISCVFSCALDDLDCGVCLLQRAQTCAQAYCPSQLQATTPCILNCAQAAQAGGDIDACLEDLCPEEKHNFEECLRPRLEGGHCNENLRHCNVEL